MDNLLEEQEKLSKRGSLSRSLEDVQKTISLLLNAREAIATRPDGASVTLAKLQNPLKSSFDVINTDLKDIYKSLGNYSKALDKKFKDKPLPITDYDGLSSHPMLIRRAVAMHLLREGHFDVASTFISEAGNKPHYTASTEDDESRRTVDDDIGLDALRSEALRQEFTNMYYVLYELKNHRNLMPAIEWARANSDRLENRGSNLAFELGKLQFISLALNEESGSDQQSRRQGQLKAIDYARREFSRFQDRYSRQIEQLSGAMAFCPNLHQSPYNQMFHDHGIWDELVGSFTREFCSLLGLSADSPLYVAATAGAIALPTLLKLQNIMKEKRTEWTTQHELPVEIPLPLSYRFHSIFVCPVSKEQTTDQNPPMMMPCGHVVAQESLMRLSKGSRFKCPYCPGESHPRDAKKIFL